MRAARDFLRALASVPATLAEALDASLQMAAVEMTLYCAGALQFGEPVSVSVRALVERLAEVERERDELREGLS